jgi:hypothetical protein
VFHHYLPDRRSQTRGVTAFAPMADTADHWDDLQFANLVAAKIQSCYTILREMDAGAPVLPFAGGGDHSETTETRPDGETRTLTDIAPGFEIYDEWKVRQWAVTDSALRKAVECADSLRASLAAAASWCRHTPRRRRFVFIPIVPLARTGPARCRSPGGRIVRTPENGDCPPLSAAPKCHPNPRLWR